MELAGEWGNEHKGGNHMCRQMKRGILFLLAVLAVIIYMPLKTQAAEEPVFKKERKYFYENRSGQGVYNIKVKNVK